MTRQERELREQITQIKNTARQLVAEDKIKEAQEMAAEARNLTEKADFLAGLEVEDAAAAQNAAGNGKPAGERAAEYNNVFFKALRGKSLTSDEKNALEKGIQNADGLHETPDENGGYIVPQDVQTTIHEYKRSLSQLEPLITVTPVSTNKGSRVYEKLSNMVAFENLTDDADDIAEMVPPKFEKITYSIKDYAGWLPIPNDLLDDTDQNIMAYLAQWIGKKSVVTRNGLILAILRAKAAVNFADYKAIKKALNVTLDPMLAAGAVIVTNQDGFQYLDTLEDKTGKPLLQVDVTQPSRKLFAGHVVEIIGNTVMPSAKSGASGSEVYKAPVLVGSLQDAVALFERKGYRIDSTNIGGMAFRKNRTEIRVIEREDVVGVDSDSFVYGQIDVTSVI